jgi:ABC-type bacteriocin/lantibiotic exporter with double-glycine peptidase domain
MKQKSHRSQSGWNLLQIVFLAVILGGGCRLMTTYSIEAPSVWLDVPFSKQEKNLCGAACLYMIMEYWKIHQTESSQPASFIPIPTLEEISANLYSAQARGIYGSQMADYLEGRGFQTFIFKGSWADLENHLSKGRPLIIALGGPRSSDPKHYAVITGLDSSQKIVFLNDPARRKLGKVDQSDFLEAWRKTSNWTLLAVPQSGT